MAKKIYSWVIALLIFGLLGVLRHTVSEVIKGRYPALFTILSICLLSLIVLICVIGKLWGYNIQISYFLSNGWRVFGIMLIALLLFMLPGSLAENSIWIEWMIDIGIATAVAATLAATSERVIRGQIPDSPE